MDLGDSYIDRLARSIRSRVPPGKLPDEETSDLFRGYAVLLLAVGGGVRPEDVHNAWVAWMASRDDSHESLVPYAALDAATAREDDVFVQAIKSAAQSERLE